MKSGYGIIVSDGLLVIDVDPRNGGAQGYAELIKDVPEIAGANVIIETGRKDGGKHIYFKAPRGVSLMQTLKNILVVISSRQDMWLAQALCMPQAIVTIWWLVIVRTIYRTPRKRLSTCYAAQTHTAPATGENTLM